MYKSIAHAITVVGYTTQVCVSALYDVYIMLKSPNVFSDVLITSVLSAGFYSLETTFTKITMTSKLLIYVIIVAYVSDLTSQKHNETFQHPPKLYFAPKTIRSLAFCDGDTGFLPPRTALRSQSPLWIFLFFCLLLTCWSFSGFCSKFYYCLFPSIHTTWAISSTRMTSVIP